VLTITNVSKAFGGVSVLKDITFDIQTEGTVVGLAGPSGCGKSTLLRLIQSLEKPDQGTIVCKLKTGFIFQDFQLFPHMTVLENITYALKFHPTSQDVMGIVDHLGLSSKLHAYPQQLSGGQKQRTAIARSLVTNARLLLCDEPTSGLDMATTQEVITLFKTIKNMGVTMLVASHDLDFLNVLSDRMLILKHTVVTDITL
jgi:polar amino acid transport system ATP-binding protein